MEYADDGDVYQKIVELQKNKTYFEEDDVWRIFIQMTRGLKALHKLRILHRDMKSANIFLSKEMSLETPGQSTITVKLGDLNVSKVAKGAAGLLYTQTGTPYYASPEVWKDQPYDSKSDVWSLGCVLYEITALQPPFRAQDMDGLFKKVLKGLYPKIPVLYSDELNKMLKRLIAVNPNLRPNCEQILALDIVQKYVKRLNLPDEENEMLNDRGEDENFPNSMQNASIDPKKQLLLSTIRLPQNLKLLSDRLPKSKYDDEIIPNILATQDSHKPTNDSKTGAKNYDTSVAAIRTGGKKK